MMNKFNKFNGSIMSLDKLDVINILDIITNLKPSLPELVDNSSISKLIDNKVYYNSEDKKFKISVYFRESDEYLNKDGSITYGDFKSLYRISIRKVSDDFKISDVSDYLDLLCKIVGDTYDNSKIILKVDNERVDVLESDNKVITNIKIIIRIK